MQDLRSQPETELTNILGSGVFPSGSVVKNLPANAVYAGDVNSIPGSRRPTEGGNSNLFQCCCQDNPRDSKAWWATVHGVAKNQT